MYYTNDPVADAERYIAEQERYTEKLPVCDCCLEHIQDEYYYDLGGELFCQECLDNEYRKNTEDYVERR